LFSNMLMAMQDAGTAREAADYAARQALSTPSLATFSGGDSITVGGVLLVALIVILVLWLI
jgi:hypothetical protein